MFGNDPTEVTVEILYYQAIESVDRKIRRNRKSTQSLISNNNFYSDYFDLDYDVDNAKKAKMKFQEKSAEVKSGQFDQETKQKILEEMKTLNSKLEGAKRLKVLDIEEVVEKLE